MEATPYVSIRTVLYDISTMLDSKEWNEANMLEWAYRALRKNKSNKVYTTKVVFLNVIEHKFILPKDLKYIYQIAYKVCTSDQLITDIKEILGLTDPLLEDSNIPYSVAVNFSKIPFNKWTPLRLSPSPFALAVHCSGLPPCNNCDQDYTIDETLTGTTSLKEAKLLVSYMAYPQNEDGDALIPDDPDLKDAIMHYCLYRHYLSKSLKAVGTDQYADKQKMWHLSMFETLSAKASGQLNMPSLNELDNMKRNANRLVPRAHQYDKFFLGLNHEEKYNNA